MTIGILQVVEKKSKSAAPVKAAESNGVSPAKRGRGRPKKGTSKAATKKATPTKSGRGRGRPPAKSAAKKKSESEGEGSDDAADEAEEAGSD